METRTDLEERLRGYAREYDREFPPTSGVERRIIARIALAPSPSARASRRPWAWGTAGGLARELAIVTILVLLAGVLVVGAAKLRSLQPRSVTPQITSTPPAGKPAQPIPDLTGLQFVSARVGWIAETKTNTGTTGPGPTFIYKTTDGGHSWQQQLSWDGPGPDQGRFSADGLQGLLVGQGGVPLFRTIDGGAHWQRMALPPAATQVALQYFLDPSQGWIISYLNGATPGIAGVFHTTDGGQTWTETARVDVNEQFSHGQLGGSLQGNLVFRDSSTGWLTPYASSATGVTPVPPFQYVTHDGGKTWAVQEFASPAGVALNSSTAIFLPPEFFNDREGVVLVTRQSVPTAQGSPIFGGTYAYTTTDGGDHWSAPHQVVVPGGYDRPPIWMIDARTWLSFGASQSVARTTDAGLHWKTLPGALPPHASGLQVEFQDVNHGWAAVIVFAAEPTLGLYQTSDGGAHWTALTVPALGGPAAGG
jgi:photosystem II stability/assembly factor-like uncharacterized protein